MDWIFASQYCKRNSSTGRQAGSREIVLPFRSFVLYLLHALRPFLPEVVRISAAEQTQPTLSQQQQQQQQSSDTAAAARQQEETNRTFSS